MWRAKNSLISRTGRGERVAPMADKVGIVDVLQIAQPRTSRAVESNVTDADAGHLGEPPVPRGGTRHSGRHWLTACRAPFRAIRRRRAMARQIGTDRVALTPVHGSRPRTSRIRVTEPARGHVSLLLGWAAPRSADQRPRHRAYDAPHDTYPGLFRAKQRYGRVSPNLGTQRAQIAVWHDSRPDSQGASGEPGTSRFQSLFDHRGPRVTGPRRRTVRAVRSPGRRHWRRDGVERHAR